MKLKRAAQLLTIVLTGLLPLAACSSPTSQPGGATTTGADTALAELQKSGVLKVGTEGTYSPFTFHDADTNELTGYDIEVITAVAEKLGVKAEFSETKWDAIFAGLEAKRYDLVANEVSINAERQAKYDLTDPYSVSYPVVIVKADNTDITSLDSVKGKTTAQTATSNWADFAREAGATVEPVDGFTEAVAAVKAGRVDATFNDNLAALEYFNTTKDTSVKVGFEVPDEKVTQAFALRKDSGLVEPINAALKDLAADGTLAKIGEKWFGEDISK
ncbi:amino acid ABC transporter substrate-binding protein [Propionicicella superfundia]|uniref:amino acid ABC transporter substrate-binding protein n=1 Tax=Propionicicella superfundia TaxID=348582 RepID=UPI0004203650|nr:amino acid ABC transporter substrate-binding protein [Propionicicella superfundia]